jgi:RNA recognition motif-containing protein
MANLSFQIDDEKLREEFKECGDITNIQWMFEKGSQKFYGKGFATFKTSAGAAAAVAFSGSKVLGRPVRVELVRNSTRFLWHAQPVT